MNACASTKDQLQSVSDNLCINLVTSRADFLPFHQRAGVYTLWAKTHRTGVLNSKFCPCEFEAQPLADDCVSHFQAHAAPPDAFCKLHLLWHWGAQHPCAQQGAILIAKDRLAGICLCHSKADETTAWNVQAGEAPLKKGVVSWGKKKKYKLIPFLSKFLTCFPALLGHI